MQPKPSRNVGLATEAERRLYVRDLLSDEAALAALVQRLGFEGLTVEAARRALEESAEGGVGAPASTPARSRRGYAARTVRDKLGELWVDLQRMAPPALDLQGKPNHAFAAWNAKGAATRLEIMDARLETALELFATLPGQSMRTPPSFRTVAREMRARGFEMTPAQARTARDLFLEMTEAERCEFSRVQSFSRVVARGRFVTTWEVDPATGQRTRPIETRLEMSRPYRRKGDISPEAERALESNYRPSPCERRLLALVAEADAQGEDGTSLLERFLDWTGPRCERCGFAIPSARPGQRYGSQACRQAAHAAAKNAPVSDAGKRD